MKEEIVFKVSKPSENEGWYLAEAVGYSIFTEAKDLDDLVENTKEAVECFFKGETKPIKLILTSEIEMVLS